MSTTPPLPPAAEPPTKKRSGCLIALVIVLLLLVGGCVIGGSILYFKRGSLAAWGIDKLSAGAMTMLAEDVPPETRDEFAAAFATYRDNMVSLAMGQAPAGTDPSQFQRPMEQIQTAMQDQSISLEEAERFIELVHQGATESE